MPQRELNADHREAVVEVGVYTPVNVRSEALSKREPLLPPGTIALRAPELRGVNFLADSASQLRTGFKF
jgi:hypothetical protein